jgi:hypothetical protein
MSGQFLTTHDFIYCDDQSDVVCTSFMAEKVTFSNGGSVRSTYSRLPGPWHLSGESLAVGERVYRLVDEGRYLYSPRIEGADFGTYLVPLENLSRVQEMIGSKVGDPARYRNILHYELTTTGDALSPCIALMRVGDWSSIPYLLDQLPHRPRPSGVIDTTIVCVRALEKITGAKPGITREDWDEWLTAHPSP